MDEELNKISEKALKAEASIDFLLENHFLEIEEKEAICKRIEEFKACNFVFITKPFKTCDSMGKTLYHLMISLSRRKHNEVK